MLICMQMKKKKLYMSGVPYLAPTRTFVGAEGVENGENANFLIFVPNLVLLSLILFDSMRGIRKTMFQCDAVG